MGFCKKINNQENIYFGTGNEIRSWINIKDVVRFIYFLIKKNIKYKILDISGNEVIKNKTLLEKLFKLNKLKSAPNFNNTNKKGDPLKQIFDNSKLKKLNWIAKTKLSDGLQEYLLWFKKDKKIKVAFIITPNVNWMGELNYFKSLIGAINDLNEKIPLEFYVFTSNDEKNFIQKKYPKINVIRSSILNSRGILSSIKKVLSFLFRGHDPLLTYLLKKFYTNYLPL